jgi:hypothetical protein
MSLRISLPFGHVLLSSILATFLISGCSEFLARNAAITSFMPEPTINGYPQLATKLMLLDKMVADSGHPDCILVGSSMVNFGIDPDGIDSGYQQDAEESFSCFNFALNGLSAVGTERLSRILISEYHPRLLIYGLSFRDFVDVEHPLNNAWLRYHLGEPSLEGWLEVNSYAYRYGLSYRQLLRENDLNKTLGSERIHMDGFVPVDSSTIDLNIPDSNDYAKWSGDYQMLPEELQGFDQLLALNSSELQIVLVEMPLAPGVYDHLPNGQDTRREFIEAVSHYASARGIPFFLTQDLIEFPDGSWNNPTHLSAIGAGVFGQWIGSQLARMVQSNELSNPVGQ